MNENTFIEKARNSVQNLSFVKHGDLGHEVRQDWVSAYEQITDKDQALAHLESEGLCLYRILGYGQSKDKTVLDRADADEFSIPIKEIHHDADLIEGARENIHDLEQRSLYLASQEAVLEKIPELNPVALGIYANKSELTGNEFEALNRLVDETTKASFIDEITTVCDQYSEFVKTHWSENSKDIEVLRPPQDDIDDEVLAVMDAYSGCMGISEEEAKAIIQNSLQREQHENSTSDNEPVYFQAGESSIQTR